MLSYVDATWGDTAYMCIRGEDGRFFWVVTKKIMCVEINSFVYRLLYILTSLKYVQQHTYTNYNYKY